MEKKIRNKNKNKIDFMQTKNRNTSIQSYYPSITRVANINRICFVVFFFALHCFPLICFALLIYLSFETKGEEGGGGENFFDEKSRNVR